MSTVVLTPTHIACDHTVIHKSFPNESRVDLAYRKIFVPPSRKFVIGTIGEFIPENIDTPETYRAVEQMLFELIAQRVIEGLQNDFAVFTKLDPLNHYEKVFDLTGRTFIVSRRYRFVIFYASSKKLWCARRIGDYAGIGSGGMIATGLLLGKTPLEKIWEPLHQLDHLSSVEHTSIPLSSLKRGRINR